MTIELIGGPLDGKQYEVSDKYVQCKPVFYLQFPSGAAANWNAKNFRAAAYKWRGKDRMVFDGIVKYEAK